MKFVNIAYPEERLDFPEAVIKGLGHGHGLFMPERIAPLEGIPELLQKDFVSRSAVILKHLIGDAVPMEAVRECVAQAFNFPLKLRPVSRGVFALELFHGPSLAFKDFGARFLAQCLSRFTIGRKTTILTATSGDTGAAVAMAFYEQPGVDVVVLYPRGKITPLQEKLFCTLGGNIQTIAIDDDFDACQSLVKQAFDDPQLVEEIGLNSANSINIARLLAQVCYYFEALAQLPPGVRPVLSVPSGNFGNITAGLIAHVLGLSSDLMIAATNSNDTVPRFLDSGLWAPKPTVQTITSAMDISQPNNYARVRELDNQYGHKISNSLKSTSVDDATTRAAIVSLDAIGYLADPHSALAWKALTDNMSDDATGVFLCTAHPAKFKETVEDILNCKITLPRQLAQVSEKDVLNIRMQSDFNLLRDFLMDKKVRVST